MIPAPSAGAKAGHLFWLLGNVLLEDAVRLAGGTLITENIKKEIMFLTARAIDALETASKIFYTVYKVCYPIVMRTTGILFYFVLVIASETRRLSFSWFYLPRIGTISHYECQTLERLLFFFRPLRCCSNISKKMRDIRTERSAPLILLLLTAVYDFQCKLSWY